MLEYNVNYFRRVYMNNGNILLPSSIGLIVLAIIYSFVTWNNSNLWIPISSILIVLSIIVFVIRSTFASMEERLKKLEK
jgi:ABC-type glycerol-3-phosphate transport system permease component